MGSTLTFYPLPRLHHRRLKSTNMMERLNEELPGAPASCASSPTSPAPSG